MEGGGEEDGGESVGWRYVGPVRRRVYERNPKHGPIDRGEISREPKNGQEALDNSVQVKSASTGRIGIDYNEGEFVVFRRTVTEFHERLGIRPTLHPIDANAIYWRREA